MTVRVAAVFGNNHEFNSSQEIDQSALDAVLLDFNPSGDPRVARIKALHAALIQEMQKIRDNDASRPAQKRCAAIAITELEGTQMRAVKALFAK